MHKIALGFLILFTSQFTNAQSITSLAPNVTITSDLIGYDHMDRLKVKYYDETYAISGSGKGKVYIVFVSKSSLKLVWEKELETKINRDKVKYTYIETILGDSSVSVLYGGVNNRTKKYEVIKGNYNVSDGKSLGFVKLLDIPAINQKDIMVSFNNVLDNQYGLLEMYTFKSNVEATTISNFAVFDLEGNVIHTASADTKTHFSELSKLVSVIVNSNLDIFLSVNMSNWTSKPFQVIKISRDGTYESKNIELSEVVPNSAKLFFKEDTKELLVTGFFGLKNKTNLNGSYTIVFDKDFSKRSVHMYPFTQKMVTDMVTVKYDKEKTNPPKRANYEYRSTVQTDEGGYFIIHENLIISDYSIGSYFGGLFVTYFNKSHELEYYTMFRKNTLVYVPKSIEDIQNQKVGVMYEDQVLQLYYWMKGKELKNLEELSSKMKSEIIDGNVYGVKAKLDKNGNQSYKLLFTYDFSAQMANPITNSVKYSEQSNDVLMPINSLKKLSLLRIETD